jgi:hypothetical protein
MPVADSGHSHQLHYDHGFLETHTLGATLTSKEIMTAMNAVSTPDQGGRYSKISRVWWLVVQLPPQ